MKLEVMNVSKSFERPGSILFQKGEKTQAVKNVSFSISDGESLGLVGESGSGKTTLAKMIMGFLKPTEGSVLLDSQEVSTFTRAQRARKIQMVFQDPFASVNPKLLLHTQLEEGMKAAGLADTFRKATQLMVDVGLPPEFLSRYPHQLSGGQRQRFAIARALSMEPELLIADEPVSSLDLTVQAQIIKLLNSLREKRNFMLLIISHDLAVIAHLCEKALVLKEGALVEQGPIQSLLKTPKTDYVHRLVQATPTV